MKHNDYSHIISDKIGIIGEMCGGSKTGYRNSNPDHLVVFNANIIVNGEKVWFGDIDISIHRISLQTIAVEENIDIYILREMDGRFEYEDDPQINKAVAVFYGDGKVKYDKYVEQEKENYIGL